MKKEKLMRRFFVSKIFLVIGVVVLGLLSLTVGKKVLEEREIKKEIKSAQDEITRLEAKNSELNDFLSYLNTDDFLEEEAREKFNLQKSGESVMVVPGSGGAPEENQEVTVAGGARTEQKNPAKWWNYFFNQ